MATLYINGQSVTVDDSFLSLPPDQQNATVDEIAQSLGKQSPERGGLSSVSETLGVMGDAAKPVIRNISDAATTFGHHAMNFPHGIAQGIENVINYGAQKLPDNPVSRYINDVVTQDNRAMAEREQQYRTKDTDSIGGYTGAIAGEVAPYVIGTPAKLLQGAGNVVSRNLTRAIPQTVPKIIPKIVGGAGNAAAQSAIIAGITPEVNVNDTTEYFGKKSEDVPKAAKYGALLGASIPVAQETIKGIGKVGKNLLGLTTQQGPENIAIAAESGYSKDPNFWKNFTGKADQSDALETARAGLQNMRQGRGAAYATGIKATRDSVKQIDFSPIDDALNNVVSSMKEGNHWKIDADEVKKINKLQQIVAEWRNDPSMHTAIGLDALKQRLQAIYPSSPDFARVQRAVTSVSNSVKDLIVKESPEYAKTMSDFSQAIEAEKQISKALSLGGRDGQASADTAIRKLLSLTRNNANTNYGNRLALAKALEDKGGVSVLPALSGQSMNTWLPRGQVGQAANVATLAAATQNPAALAALPLQSPKVVGATLYGGGRAAREISDFVKKTGMTPEQARTAALLLMQNRD